MKVGINTYIHPTALIGQNVSIGDNCHIGPYCIIGFPAEWKGKENECKGVIILDGVTLTGLVTIDTGVENMTIIGTDCYLMKHCHVGHDAVLYAGVTLSCGAKVGGHAEIGAFTNIGLNAVIHQKKVVPESCMIGMGAVITKGLAMEEGQKYAGNPARWLSKNVKSSI